MNGDDPAAMDVARDPYSQIITDSPWRWVPVFVGPLGFLAIGVGLDTEAWSLPNIAAWVAFVVLFLLLRVSRAKDGMADAFRIAVKHARATGGRRINSRPWMARTLIVLGIAMVFTSAVAHTLAGSDVTGESGVVRVFRSFGFLMPGTMLILMGVARPWDLEVVESGDSQR